MLLLLAGKLCGRPAGNILRQLARVRVASSSSLSSFGGSGSSRRSARENPQQWAGGARYALTHNRRSKTLPTNGAARSTAPPSAGPNPNGEERATNHFACVAALFRTPRVTRDESTQLSPAVARQANVHHCWRLSWLPEEASHEMRLRGPNCLGLRHWRG